jgi:hypothetical protein
MSTAQDKMINYILNVASNETDLQKLAYGAKGIETLANTEGVYGGEAYGVSWDEENDVYTRTGSNAYTTIQDKMRRCLLNSSGVVTTYLNALNSNYTDTGAIANLTGTNGNVMVEIPKFYYKYSYVGTTHNWSISLTPLDGYAVHPAFNKGVVEVEHRYIGAYNASVSGTGSNAVLKSVSGEYCDGNMTRAEMRTRAKAIGTGWGILDFNLVSAIQLLMLVEFNNFNTQSAIGMGRTQLYGGSFGDGRYYGLNGLSNSIGNATGNVDYVGDADDAGAALSYMSYRGIENFYGNVWKWVDGINIQDFVPFVSNDPTLFADDVFTGSYISAGITMSSSSGYQNTLVQTGRGFFPASIGAGSSTKITDFYWEATGNRGVVLGATAEDTSHAGAFTIYLVAAGASSVSMSSILAF